MTSRTFKDDFDGMDDRKMALIRIEQLQRRAAIVDAATLRAHQLRDEAIDQVWASARNGVASLARRAHAFGRAFVHAWVHEGVPRASGREQTNLHWRA